jgi:hypothetical protein
MPSVRLRIRTIMIAMAALAVLMGAVRALTLCGLSAWAGIQESELIIVISVPSKAPGYFGWKHYVTKISTINAVAVVGVLIAILPLTVYFRSRRKRRGSALGSANRQFHNPEPDQSGESTSV